MGIEEAKIELNEILAINFEADSRPLFTINMLQSELEIIARSDDVMADYGIRDIERLVSNLKSAFEDLQICKCNKIELKHTSIDGLSNSQITINALIKFENGLADTYLSMAEPGTKDELLMRLFREASLEKERGFTFPESVEDVEMKQAVADQRSMSFDDFQFANNFIEKLELLKKGLAQLCKRLEIPLRENELGR